MTDSSKPRGHHVVPLSTYVAVGAALFILTGLTVAVASTDLGGWNAVAAFTIAALKTALVAAIFMHLFWDHKIFLAVFLTGIVFLAVFIAFTMFDVLRRDDLYQIAAEPIEKQAAMYQQPAASPVTPTDSLVDTTAQAAESEHP